jgi:HAD superfamily hydrolase (TIGR01450 family)
LTILCDLDGVIYRGARALPGVPEALERLLATGISIYFITNNSTRTPQATAEKISTLTGVPTEADQVLTSGMAAMTMLGAPDGPVLVVGEDGLREAVEDGGLTVTDDPSAARSVVVGLTRSLSYEMISGAMQAIRAGARFVATNDDTTFPTEDGLAPGCGAIVAAIAAASGRAPEVAGKPNEPMRDLIRSRVGRDAWVIGDRVDTDIALAATEPGWRSVLVLTGITDIDQARGGEADFVVADFPAAVDLVLRHSQQS